MSNDQLFDRFAQPAAWVVAPGTREMLTGLRLAGLKLAVISNWDERLPRLLEWWSAGSERVLL